MENTTISFENLPAFVLQLGGKVDTILALLEQPREAEQVQWMSLDELINYLPMRPSRATVYGWVQDGLIPFSRPGKNLAFQKSAIDQWLLSKTGKTPEQVAATAEARLSSVRRPRRKVAARRP